MKKKRWISLVVVLCLLMQMLPVSAMASVQTAGKAPAAAATEPVDLIPDEPNTETPNYVCTWSFQDWAAYSDDYTPAMDSNIPRDMLNHEQLFGENGWVNTAYQDSKQDLIFLLDDGWDLPKGGNGSYFGSFLVSPDKFPDYGDTPQERLKTLVENIENAGWKGAGVWVCASEMSSEQDGTWNEDYWRERLEWSKYAGVDYWKIDWGNHSGDAGWRQMVSDLADEIYPELVIEHITGYGTLNSDADNGTRLSEGNVDWSAYCASYSDVYRTYDVNGNLSIATTFERIGRQLEQAYTNGRQLGLINGEDEVYMCSALGLIFGVMRYDIGDASSGSLPNIFFGGDETFTETRPIRKMLDEVQRATMWQRVAPAYRMDAYQTVISDEALADTWVYSEEDTWDWGRVQGREVTQKAPAVIARGIDMPVVTAVDGGPKPFVAASRNPNGAISIGTYGRTSTDTGYQVAKADVALNAGDLTGLIGVFGYYNNLSLTFNQDLHGKEIYAQDLMGDTAENITNTEGVTISEDGKTITFSGELLARIGLSAKTEDYSEPGLAIRIGEEADFVEAPAIRYIPESRIPNSSFELTTEGESEGELDALVWDEWANENKLENFYVEKGDAHSGDYYAVQKGDADYCGGLYYSLSDLQDGVYDVSVWVKASEHTKEGDPASACLVAKNFQPSDQGLVYAEIPQTDEWTEIRIEGIPVTSGKMHLEIYSDAAAGEYIYFDDFNIEMSKDMDAIASMVESVLGEMMLDNGITEESLLAEVEDMLDSYDGMTASITDFQKTEATDDTVGALSGTVILKNASGDTVEIPFNLSIPRTSLVYNASFELSTYNGQQPEGWEIWYRSGGNGNFYVESKPDLGGAHSGDWYGMHWGSNGYDGSTYQIVKNLPNGMYRASVWVKNTPFTSSTADPCAACFVVKDFGQGSTGSGLKYVDLSAGNSEWTQVEIEDVPVTNGQMHIEIYTQAKNGTLEWIMFDDFVIEPYEYDVAVAPTENGAIAVSSEKASEGETIELTVTPATSYRLKDGTLKVYKTDDPETTVPVENNTFVMPGYGVTVTAEFEPATPVGEKSVKLGLQAPETVAAGSEFEVKGTIGGLDTLEGPVAGLQMIMTYPEGMTCTEVTPNEAIKDEMAYSIHDDVLEVNFGYISGDLEAGLPVDLDSLFTAKFTASADMAEGDYTFGLKDIVLSDWNGEEVPYTAEGASVHVTELPKEPQLLTVQWSGNASMSVEGEAEEIIFTDAIYGAKVQPGEELTFTFTPTKGAFSGAQLNGEDIEFAADGCTYTFTMPGESTTLCFTFTSVDKSILGIVLEEANAVPQDVIDSLVPSAKEFFENALAKAQEVYDDADATEEEVKEAWSDLLDAMHLLEFEAGDKETLLPLINIAEQLKDML
ncbi:InlB B-repeat-containing protein, partial [Anaeromassilibacillus sp. D41t1_190614_C2]|uniref:InlB B-repeat-containing protein n=1 Tax=Anaeromassilibacillus sp. D41t1_190614_C2 TaxID=2787078 RepID=UPI00189F61EC